MFNTLVFPSVRLKKNNNLNTDRDDGSKCMKVRVLYGKDIAGGWPGDDGGLYTLCIT